MFLAILPVTRSLAHRNFSMDPTLEQHILNATMQIEMFTPRPGSQPSSGARPYIAAQGLGTLVNWQAEIVIVTHNHWGDMLEQAEFVRILDAQGDLELELSGVDFRGLIRYQDAGTMILNIPPYLDTAYQENLGDMDFKQAVTAGETVVFVHRVADESCRLDLLTAEVVTLTEYKDLPVFKIRSLDNQSIHSGDSGGGMWFNGQLVGNMWGRFNEQTGEAGYAADFPW